MFEFNPENSQVTMHRGDTGAYKVTLTRSSGKPFGENDGALYTVKQGSNTLIDREYALNDDDGVGNGSFIIAFRNSDTDTWADGTYNTEIRVAINPIRNPASTGPVVDGDVVRTITRSKSTLTILSVQKEI